MTKNKMIKTYITNMYTIKMRVWHKKRMWDVYSLQFKEDNNIDAKLKILDVKTNKFEYDEAKGCQDYLMRYIEIRDSHGKEIWERDIIRVYDDEGNEDISSVTYKPYGAAFVVYLGENPFKGIFGQQEKKEMMFDEVLNYKKIEVIGNQFEDNDLLYKK